MLRKPLILYILIIYLTLGAKSQETEFILRSQTYFDFVESDTTTAPIIYEEINECPGRLFKQSGIASYYANRFHGRKTSSGELFNQNKLTAAHLDLPFGTIIKVVNLSNNRFTFARVNDRGPFVPPRVIDLSRAAAQEIGLTGLSDVEVSGLSVSMNILPVNIEYFLAYSFAQDPMCIAKDLLDIKEVCSDFDDAVEHFEEYIETYTTDDFFLCLPADIFFPAFWRKSDADFYVCRIKRTQK